MGFGIHQIQYRTSAFEFTIRVPFNVNEPGRAGLIYLSQISKATLATFAGTFEEFGAAGDDDHDRPDDIPGFTGDRAARAHNKGESEEHNHQGHHFVMGTLAYIAVHPLFHVVHHIYKKYSKIQSRPLYHDTTPPLSS